LDWGKEAPRGKKGVLLILREHIKGGFADIGVPGGAKNGPHYLVKKKRRGGVAEKFVDPKGGGLRNYRQPPRHKWFSGN